MAEERYDIYSRGSSDWAISMRTEEFQEDDVWAVFKERKDFNSSATAGYNSSNVSPRPFPSAVRMIPRPGNYNSTGNPSVDQPKWVQQSAPVNIPDWSKIYGKHNSKKKAAAASYRNSTWLDHDDDAEDGNYARRGSISDSDEDDEDDSNSMMIPPHEWIAKKLARSRISSFSVCEGVGRTLKGRDLSRVRNAVLSRTGFLE